MKNNKTNLAHSRFLGFSLIEMLLTLIIISLLVSAFVPVVTKKLKSSDITVGSFGTAVTSGECDQFSSEHHNCIMCTTNACSLCSSQMDLAAGQYVDPAISCDPKECTDFGDDCIGCNKKGCTTCTSTVSIGYFRDPENKCAEEKCSDKFGANCSACNKDTCTSCVAGSGLNTATNTCEKCSAGYSSPGGMSKCEKCEAGKISSEGASSCSECSVADHKVANSTQTACENKYCGAGKYIDGITCKDCTAGTYQNKTTHQDAPCPGTCSASDHKVVNANKTGCESIYCKIANQYIDGVTCKSCPVGTYHALVSSTGDQNTSCTSCPTGCSACTSATKCTGCTGVYTLNSDGKCVKGCSPQTVTLSGTTTQVTKFNMGDDPDCSRDVIASLSEVTFVRLGTKCDGDYCCWYGEASISGGVYSPADRTQCTWHAADKICKSIGTGWKLPDTGASMSTWYPTNSTATTGLMLCDGTANSAKASKCTVSGTCSGISTTCYPSHVWSAKVSTTTHSQDSHLIGGSVAAGSHNKLNALSVRCVKE